MKPFPTFKEVRQHLQERYPAFEWDLDPHKEKERPLGPPTDPLGVIYALEAPSMRVQFMFHEEKETVTMQIWYLAPQLGRDRWSYLVVEGGSQEDWQEVAENAFQRAYDEILPGVESLLDIWSKCHTDFNP